MSKFTALENLQTSVDNYVAEQTTRLQNEVEVMKSILDGRTGPRGLQRQGRTIVEAIAQNDLASYLGG